MVKSKAKAKENYVAKTTKERFERGVGRDDAEKKYSKNTGEFFGVSVDGSVSDAWQSGAKEGAKDYEENTDGNAYDKLYENAAFGLSKGRKSSKK